MSEMVIQVHCTPFHMRKWKPRKVATDFLTLSCAPWSTVEGAETGEERS